MHVVALVHEPAHGLDRDVRALAGGQAPDERDAQRAVTRALLGRARRAGHTVDDHRGPLREAREHPAQRAARRLAVRQERVGQEQRRGQARGDHACLVLLSLVHVAQHRDAREPRRDEPRRDRHGAHVQRGRVRLAQEPGRAHDGGGRPGAERDEPARVQQRLAQHRERRGQHVRAQVVRALGERSGPRQDERDRPACGEGRTHRLEHLQVRAVQLRGRVGDDEPARPARRARCHGGPPVRSNGCGRNRRKAGEVGRWMLSKSVLSHPGGGG
ncbi:hypothetical protein CPER28S_02585 [Cellulomonas persica]